MQKINNNKIRDITCEEALEKMLEYIDGALANVSEKELGQHIETCRGCMKKLDFQLKLKKRLAKVKPITVSKKLNKRLQTILEQNF
ncbi:MAG TPA: zf-HC2 domain-containing protein [Ignavibacteria bacterium]|jgi:anti-sigma factor (TIGR02949 family)